MMGSQELKEACKFVMDLGLAVDKADADGKIDMNDAGHLIAALGSAVPAFQGISEVPAEIADMDQAELQELYDYFEAELQLGHDKTKQHVMMALSAVKSLAELYLMIKAAKA